MRGKTCLVTGATSGIGKAATTELSRRGADVVITLPLTGERRARAAEIERASGKRPADILTADFSSLDEVRGLAQTYLKSGRPLHVLVNNAGVVMQKRTVHRGRPRDDVRRQPSPPFLLTNLLRPRWRRARRHASSERPLERPRWERARLDFDDLDARKKFGPMVTYGRSKLANILFTRELGRRIDAAKVTAHCLHPGFVASDLGLNNGLSHAWCSHSGGRLRSAEKGAETVVHLSTAPEVEGSTAATIRLQAHKPNFAASHDEDARQLWDVSARLVGLSA